MPALYAAVLKLKAENDPIISPTQGHHAYALFLKLISQTNSKMADELHESAAAKPFTISPLQGKFQRAERSLKIITGAEYWIRLTFLKEDLFACFMDATLKAASQPLRLESAIFRIDRLAVTPSDSPLCGHQHYENLLDGASLQRKISLQFLSPTAFRSKGKRNVLFPEPTLVFGSYLSKWQSFAPLKLDEAIATCWSKMITAQYKLTTHILHYDSYQETGFEGRCIFEVPVELPEDTVKTINALADFAFYCGTGAKTTMGMGQTRRLKI